MSKNIISYATYTGIGATSSAINSQAPQPLEKLQYTMGDSMAGATADKTNWLCEWFPDAVADGTLQLVNGSIYINGLALTEVVSLIIALISFLVLIMKALGDLKLFIDKTRLNTLEEEVTRLQREELTKKERLKAKAASKAKKTK